MEQHRQIRQSRYCISDRGYVRRIGKGIGHINPYDQRTMIKGSLGVGKRLRWAFNNGHPVVTINLNPMNLMRNEMRMWSVAELVLETFVGPRPEGHVPGWRNGNRGDCRAENLFWTTRKAPGTVLDWFYRPEWQDLVFKDGKLRLSYVGYIQRNTAVSDEIMARRFRITLAQVRRIREGRYDKEASWREKCLIVHDRAAPAAE